jgi:hypothetical protein
VIDHIRTIVTWIDTQVEAYMETEQSGAATEALRSFLSDYDTLRPNWSGIPKWAKWYAVNADGRAQFWEHEPYYDAFGGEWMGRSGNIMPAMIPDFARRAPPVGIDPRICLWERDGVSA